MKAEARELERDPVEVATSRLPAPLLTYLGSNTWRLEADYIYNQGEHVIVVPAGFEFDLSSVPRPLWWLIAPFDLSVTAPLLHDFLYRHAGDPPPGSVQPPTVFKRAHVDRMFGQIMSEEGVVRWRRTLAYAAVRLFARSAWREDRERKAAGRT